METGTRSLRKAFKKGSCRDWPLAMGSPYFYSFELFATTNGPQVHFRVRRSGTGTELCHLNMQVVVNPKPRQHMTYVSIPRQLTVRIDPFPEGLAPHPGQLPLRQLARRRNGPPHPLLQGVLPVEVRPQLSVAHRAHRRMTGEQLLAAA